MSFKLALPLLLLIPLAALRSEEKSAESQRAAVTGTAEVSPLPPEVSMKFKLPLNFYKKSALTQNIVIATSDKVSDYAIREAAYQFDQVMKNLKPDIAQRIRDKEVVCLLVAHNECISEMPQFASTKTGKELDFYNWRNRGCLDKKNGHLTVLFSEEDVMEYDGGMQLESILIHEFGHVVQGGGFTPELEERLTKAFKNAKEKGLWKDGYAAQRFRRVTSATPVSLYDALVKAFPAQSPELLRKCLDGGDILVNGKPTNSKVEITQSDKVLIVFGGPKQCYALSNRAEYWAEGFQSWFDTNRTMDHDHNHIHTRAQVKEYDTELAKLLEDVVGDSEWRFVSPRTRAGKAHLQGYDPVTAPKVKLLDHIESAAQDYYDEYWKSYWKRLYDKYGMEEKPLLSKPADPLPK